MDLDGSAVIILDFSLDVDCQLNIEWVEGVEELKGKSIDELYNDLGLSDKLLPFFNMRHAPDSTIWA